MCAQVLTYYCIKKVGVEKDETMRWREYVRGCRRNQKNEKNRYPLLKRAKSAIRLRSAKPLSAFKYRQKPLSALKKGPNPLSAYLRQNRYPLLKIA